jgi:hypothetical protein
MSSHYPIHFGSEDIRLMVTTTTEYSLTWILPFVRKALAQSGSINQREYFQALWMELEKAKEPGIERASLVGVYGQVFDYAKAARPLLEAATDAFFFLLRNGYITEEPPTDWQNFNRSNQYRVTERGKAWLSETEPLPELVDDYMGLIHERIEPLDPVVKQYTIEALRTFNDRSYFASAVMLGAASEKVIYLLAEALRVALKESNEKAELREALKGRSLLSLLTKVTHIIKHHKAKNESQAGIPYPTYECIPHIESLFDAIRFQRNGAVHPRTGIVSPDSVRMMLRSFPFALWKIAEVVEWCKHNKSTL